MDPNTFVYLVITFMAIIVVLSTIKTVILHYILDNVEEIVYLIKSMKFDSSASSNKLTELNTYASFMSGNVMDIRTKLSNLGKKKEKDE